MRRRRRRRRRRRACACACCGWARVVQHLPHLYQYIFAVAFVIIVVFSDISFAPESGEKKVRDPSASASACPEGRSRSQSQRAAPSAAVAISRRDDLDEPFLCARARVCVLSLESPYARSRAALRAACATLKVKLASSAFSLAAPSASPRSERKDEARRPRDDGQPSPTSDAHK